MFSIENNLLHYHRHRCQRCYRLTHMHTVIQSVPSYTYLHSQCWRSAEAAHAYMHTIIECQHTNWKAVWQPVNQWAIAPNSPAYAYAIAAVVWTGHSRTHTSVLDARARTHTSARQCETSYFYRHFIASPRTLAIRSTRSLLCALPSPMSHQ